MMPPSHQAGFTLVELMVALLIGSVIVLGAGSLFLTTLQTFQKVDELSRKQEAMIFAAHTLSRDIRLSKTHYELTCEVSSNDQCECTLENKDDDEPVITFLRPPKEGGAQGSACAEDGLIVDKGDVVKISLPLEKDGEALKFQVTRRQPVLDALQE